MPANHIEGSIGHAAMVGDEAPAVGGPNDLDDLLYPPPARPYRQGRVSEYQLTATDVAKPRTHIVCRRCARWTSAASPVSIRGPHPLRNAQCMCCVKLR